MYLYYVVKKHIMALILKSPCNVNVLGLKQSFIEEVISTIDSIVATNSIDVAIF